MPTDQAKAKLKSAYLSISKAKQFQSQPKKIQKLDEKLQEEDKKYLRKQNADHHFHEVVNKTIEDKIACIWGCSSTCTIESNYICTGGTTSSLMSGTWTFLPVTPIS